MFNILFIDALIARENYIKILLAIPNRSFDRLVLLNLLLVMEPCQTRVTPVMKVSNDNGATVGPLSTFNAIGNMSALEWEDSTS